MVLSFYAKPHPDWVVEVNHRNRTVGFAFAFAIVGWHMLDRHYGPLVWALLALQFLVYPQVLYWHARNAAQPRRAEQQHLLLDSLLFGAWFAFLGFPLWITFGMCVTTSVNHAAYLGYRGAARSLAALTVGALLAVFLGGLRFAPQMDWPVAMVCMAGVLLYQLSITSTAFGRNHKLHEARAQLRAGEEALRQQLGEIHVLQERLREQANRDALTGLYNRRYLDDTLARELARCKREGQPLCLMLIDIDHFKQVNDTYGHPAGDEVLKSLARMLDGQARSADVACRYGGEEFLMLLPHMPPGTALERAEQWRNDFGNATVVFGHFRIHATLSVGLASYPGDGTSPENLIANADQALYHAKNQGRNRVVAFSALPHSTPLSPDTTHATA